MKRVLLAFAILGLLVWGASAALTFLPSQVVQQLPTDPQASGLEAFIQFSMPVLGLVVGILGAVYAAHRKAERWLVVFVVLAVLSLVLPAIGFFVGLLFLFSYDQTLEAIGSAAVYTGLLFPVVVFLTALVYALQQGGHTTQKAA